MKPITPGEILLEDYLNPLGISQAAASRALGMNPRAINEIVLGRRSITPEISICLGKIFGQSARFWFGVQTNCDFRRLKNHETELTSKVRPLRQVA